MRGIKNPKKVYRWICSPRDPIKASTVKKRFELIYKNNYWGDSESRSGVGSTLQSTARMRSELEHLLHSRGIRSMFDAPCGDWNWMKTVRFPADFKYIGVDIVPSLVNKLRREFSSEKVSFFQMNLIEEAFPNDIELWLCRDMLFHLSFEDIHKVLKNFIRSNITYALLKTHPNISNDRDIITGQFRHLCLTHPPFNFPGSELEIEDFNRSNLALWRRDEIAKVISA